VESAILSKIRKLHALAERAGTEAEAALAASRVQELLAKHNLELGEVLLKEDPGAEIAAGKGWSRIPYFARTLAFACEEMFDIRHFLTTGSRGWRFVFVGPRANVEAATITYEYLLASVEALAQGAKTKNLIYGAEDFLAFRNGVADRLGEMVRERKTHVLAANPGYAELIHIAEALAEKMIDEKNMKHSSGRGWGWGGWLTRGGAAYQLGHQQGGRVDLAGARKNRMLR
jgi:hypothetical protein